MNDLINKVGGIENAREIVSGAPEIGSYYIEYGLDTKKYYGYDDFCCAWYEYWDIPNAPMWQKIYSKEDFSFNRIALKDLRTAIAEHDEDHCEHEWNDLTSNGDKYRFLVCKHCDSTQNYLLLDDSRKFEVGDAVVLSRYSGDFAKANDALYVIFDFENALETLAVLSDQKGGEVRSGTEHLIHATLAEIKAGHRIDDTTDHVTDIRNHVSPNCKVMKHNDESCGVNHETN